MRSRLAVALRSRTTGALGVHRPEEMPAVVKWYREMAKDDAQFIVLEPGSTTR
jgi:hypothetical protein